MFYKPKASSKELAAQIKVRNQVLDLRSKTFLVAGV
jgi:hypothetical protein